MTKGEKKVLRSGIKAIKNSELDKYKLPPLLPFFLTNLQGANVAQEGVNRYNRLTTKKSVYGRKGFKNALG